MQRAALNFNLFMPLKYPGHFYSFDDSTEGWHIRILRRAGEEYALAYHSYEIAETMRLVLGIEWEKCDRVSGKPVLLHAQAPDVRIVGGYEILKYLSDFARGRDWGETIAHYEKKGEYYKEMLQRAKKYDNSC